MPAWSAEEDLWLFEHRDSLDREEQAAHLSRSKGAITSRLKQLQTPGAKPHTRLQTTLASRDPIEIGDSPAGAGGAAGAASAGEGAAAAAKAGAEDKNGEGEGEDKGEGEDEDDAMEVLKTETAEERIARETAAAEASGEMNDLTESPPAKMPPPKVKPEGGGARAAATGVKAEKVGVTKGAGANAAAGSSKELFDLTHSPPAAPPGVGGSTQGGARAGMAAFFRPPSKQAGNERETAEAEAEAEAEESVGGGSGGDPHRDLPPFFVDHAPLPAQVPHTPHGLS